MPRNKNSNRERPLGELRSRRTAAAVFLLAFACVASARTVRVAVVTDGPAGRQVFSAEAIEMFKNYGWPGNIRELWNTMNRLFILGDAVISTENVQKLLLEQPQMRFDPMSDLFGRFETFEELKEFMAREWVRRKG